MALKLSEILECLEMADWESSCYYARQSDEILHIFDGMVNGETNAQLIEDIREGDIDDYIPLPGYYDINEHQMMEDFIAALPSGEKQSSLFNAIRGRGAFRRFKNKIYQFDLEEVWYAFRDKCYEKIARDWCQAHAIDLIED